MKVSTEIKTIEPEEEFRICPACGYERGFHVSFLKNEAEGTPPYRIVLICPNCGARFDVGWKKEVEFC